MSKWKWEPTESKEQCRLIISPKFHDYILIDADPDHQETIAIMNMICAAPEMLEALEACAHQYRNFFPTVCGEVLTKVEEVIAKAKGGQG